MRSMVAVCALLLSGCASGNYMGIPLAAGKSDPILRELAARAKSGDKQAQLDLGIRFEDGHGVPVDLLRAKALYNAAASDGGGIQWVYVPSPGNGAKARVVSINRQPTQPGLDEAKMRLSNLSNPMVPQQ
ncbi:SEL1-like repeat protein [Novosphingobium sp. KA1]|uniref:SEL1-like repeat protein n=1 Tax=Novosphingobium sp. (strain KA1) TaxID=164608 RepID=UPI001A8EE231|nr:SEL1-like repeat protein [Novosphingobium sp. KA1]QSR20422.1 hypothetical protein CA833_0165 [Novosphingobium sp. KA1]